MLKKYLKTFFKNLKSNLLWRFEYKYREGRASLESRMSRVLKKSYLISCITGIIFGFGISSSLLHYDGRAPINILDFLGLFLFGPLALYFFLVVILLMGFIKSETIKVIQLYSRAISIGTTCFALSGLIFLCYRSATTDLTFGWATTLNLSADFIYGLFKGLAKPWLVLGEEFQPTLELVVNSQFYRTGEGFITKGAEGVATLKELGVWWKFMSMAIITYGIIPRFFIFLSIVTFESIAEVRKKKLPTIEPESEDVYLLNFDNHDLKTYFSLQAQEISIFYSLLEVVIKADLDSEADSYEFELKKNWYEKWKEIALSSNLHESFRFLSKAELIEALKSSPKPKAIKVLGDVLNFTPYHHLEEGEKIKIKSICLNSIKNSIHSICIDSHTDYKSVERFVNIYGSLRNSDRYLRWAKIAFISLAGATVLAVTGGAAAPLFGLKIGAFFGLTGAAAISHGLALLGMGALSVGGLGSTALVIGGGGLLGGVVGGIEAAKLYKDNNEAFKIELYKLIAMIECEFFNSTDFKGNLMKYKKFLIGQVEIHDLDKKLKQEAINRILEHFLSKEKELLKSHDK